MTKFFGPFTPFVISLCVLMQSNAHADLLPVQNNVDLVQLGQKSVQVLKSNLFRSSGSSINHDDRSDDSHLSVNKSLSVTDHAPTDQDASLLDRLNTVASTTVKRFSQSGLASWYGRQFHGRKSANGERFDMNAMTAAHRSLPLNCYIRVTNKTNGKSVVVKVTDRGPFHGNRMLDLSYGAAQKLGIVNSGVGNVAIERVDGPAS